ncbi:MAG: ABC transporter permease, partial [Bacillota bacterium]
MHFLRTYIMKYRGPFSIAILCVMLEAVCDLLQPTIMSKIIDVGIAGNDLDYIVFMGGVMLLITAVGALTATGRNILSGNVSQRVGTEIRADLYRKIQGLSFAQIDKLDKASLVTRLTNDVTLVQNFTNGLMRIGLKAPLLGIGSLVMATRLNLELAVVLALVVPMVGLILLLNLKMGFPFFLRVQQALDRVNAVMREYLAGVRVVKAFNRFAYEVAKFKQINEAYQNQSIKAMRFLALFSPGVAMTVNFGIVAVLWLG